MFKDMIITFERREFVIRNPGAMSCSVVFDMDDVQDDGEPREPVETFKVMAIDLKAALKCRSQSDPVQALTT